MVYVFIYLFLEVMTSTFFASQIGGLLTFVEIILSAFIGLYLLKTFQFSINDNIRDLTNGNISQDEFFAKNMNRVVGAIMLIIPGFFTDILGLFFVFGVLSFLLTKIFTFKPKSDTNQNSYNYTSYTHTNYYNVNNQNYTRRDKDEDIIDVEVIDNHDSIKQ